MFGAGNDITRCPRCSIPVSASQPLSECFNCAAQTARGRASSPPWSSPSAAAMAIVEDPPPAYHTFRHVGTQMPLSTSCVGRGINEPLLLRTISELDLQARTPSDGDLANAYFGRGAATAAGFTGGGDDDVEAGYVGAERGGNNCCNNNNNNNSGIQPFDASVPSSPRWPAMESAKTLALTCVLLVVLLATAVASLGLVLLLEQEHWSPM